MFVLFSILAKNVALGKPVTVSNVYTGHNADKHSPTNVNDGVIIYKDMFPDMCDITDKVQNPWVMIDLEGDYYLDFVVLYRRNDGELYNVGEFKGNII